MSEIKGIHYPSFQQQDMEIRDQHTVFRGFFKINQVQVRHKLFHGGWSVELTREIFERGHAAVVLPYYPVQDQVVLIEQFRLGAAATSESPWLLEVVAGMIDQAETPVEVAKREAMEEAGLTLQRMWPMLSYLSSPGGTTERIHVFLGELTEPPTEGVFGLAAEHEDIRVHVIPRQTAIQLLLQGKIDNAATVIALQWLELHLAQVRAAWGVEVG